MLIEFRNACINANIVAAIVPYVDDGGNFTVDIMLAGSRVLTFREVTLAELTDLVSALRAAINGGCAKQ